MPTSPPPKPPRSPRDPEKLLALIEIAPTSAEEDEEQERVREAFAQARAMTPAERRAELERAGFDVKGVHAKLLAFLEKYGVR